MSVRRARTSSTSDRPTVYSEATSSIARNLASSLAASASARRSESRNTSTPRSRMRATNWSCSYCARSTHSTSSNSKSSWFVGVRRFRLRSGRWTMTLRSLPTSEWTPNPFISFLLRTESLRRHDVGACCTLDDLFDVGERTDGRPLSRRLDELGRGEDLRAHRAGRGVLGPALLARRAIQPPLLGCAPVVVDAVDVGGHHEQVRFELAGKELAGEILVDHGLDATQCSLSSGDPCRRDSTATGADHHGLVIEQPADRSDLEDPL